MQEVDCSSYGHMLEVGFIHTTVTRSSCTEDMSRLRYGAFYTCTDATGFLEVRGLLPLTCLLLGFIKSLGRKNGQGAPFLMIVGA